MSTSEQTSTSDTGTSERVLRLHVWGSHATLPTLDPTSLYAAALLHATFTHNEQVRIQLASASTSLARVPLLQVLDEHSETVQLIDSVDEIRSFCTSAGLDAAVAADAEKAAKQTALHALLDDQLLDLTLHSLFSLPSNYRTVTAPAYSAVGGVRPLTSSNPLAKLAALPAAFQPSIPARLRNVVEARLTAAGLWGLGGKEVAMQSSESDDLAARAGIVPTKKRGLGASAKQATRDEFERSKLINRAREVLDVVSAALPSSPALYMLDAPEPSSVDAHVLAYLAPLVFAQPKLPIDALPRLIESSYPTLAAYLATVRERLFPAQATWVSPSDVQSSPPVLAGTQASSSLLSYFWPFDSSSKASDFAPPPTGTDTRSHARPTAPSSAPRPARPNGAPSQSPEDRRLRWGRALWICSALVGLVGYTFASGIPSQEFARYDATTSCGGATSALASGVGEQMCARRRHVVTGTFNSPDLFVLEYDTLAQTLSILHQIRAEGPHQYLAYGESSSGGTVYATTWGSPSTLSAWHVTDDYGLSFGNHVPITATGSYVHVQPPPYASLTSPSFGSTPGLARWLGSAGGPTGELHRLDPETGRIGDKVHELVFLPGGAADLEKADKSRKALRYGAHSFDCSSTAADQVAFVADLGANAVQAYSFPDLEHLYTVPSAEDGDGPRHSIPHPHLPLLFTVTEHTNFVDVYRLPSARGQQPVHIARADMLTPSQAAHRHDFRGDTLRFSSDLRFLFATTRGMTPATKGLLVAYRLDVSDLDVKLTLVQRFETRTSGGKANAIELAPTPTEHDLLILTDDELGFMDILTFDPTSATFDVKATAQLPPLDDGKPQGASHAIWLP